MPDWMIYSMVYAGSALMVYNIIRYINYARRLQQKKNWGKERSLLYIPIVLLVLFLAGYLIIGVFRKADLVVSGILFGGSVFVFVIFGLLQRITSHIQESERLEAELSAAEESSRVKSAFLANMSHEMRTPLNAIIGLDSLSLKNPSLPPDVRDHLEKVDVSARHLLELIDNVLEMSSFEKGSLKLKEQEFSLRETLKLADFVTQSGCDEKGLTYESSAVGLTDDRFIGDEMMLRHALLNVLGNAVKFTPAPGKVSFTAQQTGADGPERTLRFIIRDTGVGIGEAFLPYVFNPFSKEDPSSTDRYGGSGLGLALSRHAAEMMGGGIAVASKKGEGSVFTITVRLKAAEGPPEAEASLAGLRVLIAEDVDLNAEILADMLDMEEISSDRAENGQSAVELFSQSAPGAYGAVLMDLRMPVMDGFSAARAIRALDRPDARSAPIIALSANAFEEDVQSALEAGMNAHLAKPVDPDLLFENLRRLTAPGGASAKNGQ